MIEKLRYSKTFVFILAVTVMLGSNYLLAAESGAGSGLARYRVETLKHISAEQGKKYLAEAGIGTASQLPGTNALLITAQPRELIKASAILRIVDSKEKFVIKTIFPALAAENPPSNEQIAAEVGNISIGTFSAPPAPAAKSQALIDIHNDAVIVIAPSEQLEEIIAAIERVPILQKDGKMGTQQLQSGAAGPVARAPNEPQVTSPAPAAVAGTSLEPGEANEPDEFFSELLDSLAEAEKAAAELAERPAKPDESVTATTEPNDKIPSAPFAGSEQVKESASEAIEQPQEPNVGAIGEDFAAEEVVAKPEPEVKPAPTLEPAPVLEKKREVETEVVEALPKVRSYEPEPIADGDEVLRLNLPKKLTIIDFLGFVGEYLHLDYMYDPLKVKGDITLKLQGKLRGPIKVKDLYPLLESVLKFKGFVMARKGNLVTIVPVSEALNIDPSLQTDRGKVELGDVIITRIFNLKHIDAVNAKNLLDGMKLGVNVNTSASAVGALIVTGYAYRMARIEELLGMIDKPGEPKQFRFRQLKYTMARTLAPKIKTLAEQLGTVSIAIGASPARVTRKPGESTAAFRARQTKAAAAARAAAARPGVGKTAVLYLDADERTNRILMIGLEGQLAIIDELIDTLDVEQQDLRTLRLIEIQYVGAEEVVAKLGELGIISGGRPATSRISAGAKTAKPPSATTTVALVEEPQVVIIESTNSLLVNATAEQHAQIALIISYVDSETELASVPYVVYPLENQDPDELASVLNKLVLETTTKQDKAAKIVTTTTKKLEEDIIIIPDSKTYSLIVYASKKNQQWISSLIKQLDEYRPQVLLDVTLVEVTRNDEFNFDLDLVTKLPNLVPGGTMSSPDITALLSPFPAGRITEMMSKPTVSPLAGVTAFYADEDIQALFELMQKKQYGRVLARPKLLVNDNWEGTIKAEEKTSVVREKTDIIPGSGVSPPTSVTTVGFDSYTAGITLTITPHISKGDQLQLTVVLNRTDFRLKPDYEITSGAATKTGPTPPDLLTSDVTTTVTVPDGKTIILGGLEKITQSKGGAKVPLLGDIPLIGGLFRSTANTDTQSRLYVFVKAHILRPGLEFIGESDIEIVSAKNRATFEKYEEEMQKYEDWPGIKQEPMDPVRVLEAD